MAECSSLHLATTSPVSSPLTYHDLQFQTTPKEEERIHGHSAFIAENERWSLEHRAFQIGTGVGSVQSKGGNVCCVGDVKLVKLSLKMFHAQIPGPGDYDNARSSLSTGGQKISTAKAKTDIEVSWCT